MKKNRTTINFVKFLALAFMMMLAVTVSAQTPLPEAPVDHLDITESACATFTWRTVTYTTSGTYTDGATGDVLHLTINPATTTGSESVSACGSSYVWALNGATYNATGTYTYVVGCNTATLDLTLTGNTTTGSESVSACGSSYVWALNGATYNATGVYTYAVGCNTATLNLTLTSPSTHTTTVTANGANYTWTAGDGNTYNSSGNYDYVTGCHTETLALTLITTQIPSAGTLNFCKGQTVAAAKALGGVSSTLKFYKTQTGGVALTEITALATGTLYVSEVVATVESSRVSKAIVVNDLPLSSATLASANALLICKFIGTSNPVTFTAATTANTDHYSWTVPAGAAILTGATTNEITVSFNGAIATPGAIGNVTVSSVSSLGCVSKPKILALSTKTPTAPTALVMTSTDTTPLFNVKNPTTLLVETVGLNTLAKITKVGPYMGTNIEFTLTAPVAPTADHYRWVLPAGVTQTGGGTSNVITVNFADVTPATGNLVVSVYSVGGCGESTARSLTLARALPTAPTALVMTNSTQSNLIGLSKITKVGPYMGTTIPFTLTATPFMTQGAEATKYAWVLPAGVVCTTPGVTTTTVSGVKIIDTVPTPWSYDAVSSSSNVITVEFSGNETKTTGNLAVSVFAVNGAANSIPRTLSLARALPGSPAKIVLTDGATVLSKLGAYTAKTTPLTLTATPFTTQGAEATSFSWVLPAGVNVTAGATLTSDNGSTKTWGGTATVLTVNLAGIGLGVVSIPMTVYAVNGAGTSLPRSFTFSSAIPATPAIAASPSTTVSLCTNTFFTATSIPGASYVWGVPDGASIVGVTTGNVIEVNFAGLVTAASYAVTCKAVNGTGESLVKSLTIKKGASCREASVTTVADAFNAIAYPNPSSSVFTVEASGNGATGVQVYNMTGQLIESRQSESNSVEVGANYPSGIYNVIVNQGANVKTLRVIKK